VNRDQKKQISTIATTLATLFISSIGVIIFEYQLNPILLLPIVSISLALYASAIIILKGLDNGF
jgi:hypothetical protein